MTVQLLALTVENKHVQIGTRAHVTRAYVLASLRSPIYFGLVPALTGDVGREARVRRAVPISNEYACAHTTAASGAQRAGGIPDSDNRSRSG